ncbi:MAG: outer membrane beta-barrel protein [Bauldia sp.]
MADRKAKYCILLSVASGVSLLAVAANAQTVRRPAAPSYAPPAYDWSGRYVGGFVGAAHGMWTVDFFRNNNHGHAEEGADGLAFGAFVGYNLQFANGWVAGVEADIGHTSAKQSNNIFDNDTSLAEYGMIGSARARLGYAYDRLLLYGTLGIGFANVSNNIQKGNNAGEEVVWENQWRSGLAVGAGAEYAFTSRIAGRVEYLFNDLGDVTLYNRDGNRAEFQNELHLFRLAAAYRF